LIVLLSYRQTYVNIKLQYFIENVRFIGLISEVPIGGSYTCGFKLLILLSALSMPV